MEQNMDNPELVQCIARFQFNTNSMLAILQVIRAYDMLIGSWIAPICLVFLDNFACSACSTFISSHGSPKNAYMACS